MIEVRIEHAGQFEKAMRIFKKKCQNDGFLMELRDRRYFEKKSAKKHKIKSRRRE